MIKFDSEKYARLFARDKKFIRMGTLITPAMLIMLVLGAILKFTAPEGQGAFEGRSLASLIIIAAALLICVGIWIYFSVVHGKVKALVVETAGAYIARDEQVMPFVTESGSYVFAIKEGKKFLLYESENRGRVLHFSYEMFVSLYDGDVTFYRQTALALGAYLYKKSLEGAIYADITVTADYGNKKLGVKPYEIVKGGEFNQKLLPTFKKLGEKLYS